jgi:hypothetical protein
MMFEGTPDDYLERVRRRSRQAAIASIVGAAILFGGGGIFIYSVNRVLAKKRAEIHELTEKKAALKKDVSDLLERAARQAAALEKVDKQVKAEGAPDLHKEVRASIPVVTVATPRASATEKPGMKLRDGRPIYDFAVWLAIPADRLPEVKSVTYTFDHPSFSARYRTQTSTNRTSGFRVGYPGWGCLSHVGIKLDLLDGSSPTMDLDMCASIPGWQ